MHNPEVVKYNWLKPNIQTKLGLVCDLGFIAIIQKCFALQLQVTIYCNILCLKKKRILKQKSTATKIFNTLLNTGPYANYITQITRATTALTMEYSDIYRLSRQLQIVKRVEDCQYSCKLTIQLQAVKRVTDCQKKLQNTK